jgi:hypothetical protein
VRNGPATQATGTATAPRPPREAEGPGNPLPTREQLRAFLRAAPGRVGKSDISRHFGLSPDQRPALRELLRSLKEQGQAAPVGRRGIAAPDRLPERGRFRARLGVPPDHTLAVYSGNLGVKQGLDVLLTAAGLMPSALLELGFIGSKGDMAIVTSDAVRVRICRELAAHLAGKRPPEPKDCTCR